MMERVDPDHLPVGTLVDVWRVVRRLDGGAYGTVYEVEKDGESYALKIARYPEQSQDARHTDERAQRELSCLLTLRHRYIARVYAHGRWPHAREGFFYVVMELVKGWTLDEWAERMRVTPHEAVVLIDQVMEAVAYMHGQGIFHRDLKPGNIMVKASTGEPVVVDYGVAHFPVPAVPRLTDTHLPPGTPRYTSPEALRFEAEHRGDRAARYQFTAADELYALGVTLYDVLTDPRPHSDPQPQALQPWGFPAAHEVNQRAPVPLSRFVAKLVALKPEQRPVAVEAARREVTELRLLQAEPWTKRSLHALEFQAPVEAAIPEPAPAAAAAQGEAPRASPAPRSHLRAGAWVLASLGLGVLLVCGAYLVLRGAAQERPELSAPVTAEAPAQVAPTPAAQPQPPVLPLASPPLASPPLPQAPPSQPVVPPQKGTPVNIRRVPEAAVPPLCSQKTPPPRGTSQWWDWCKCTAIAGTLVASQAGCPAAQVRQSVTGECTTDSVAAMKFLELPDKAVTLMLLLDPNQPAEFINSKISVTDGQPLTSKVTRGRGKLVKGSVLSGRVFQQQLERWSLAYRWNEATLPDGSKYPVCIEYGDDADPGATPGTWMANQVTEANTFWGWRDTAELTR